MKRLHILTKADDAIAQEIIAAQRELGGAEIEVADLSGPAPPDYGDLLERIFRAESIQVW